MNPPYGTGIVARHLGLPVVGHLPIACPVLGFYDLFSHWLPAQTRAQKVGAMPDAIQAKHGFTVLKEYIQNLITECREAIEEAENCIARSKKARDKSKELLIASRNLRTH